MALISTPKRVGRRGSFLLIVRSVVLLLCRWEEDDSLNSDPDIMRLSI